MEDELFDGIYEEGGLSDQLDKAGIEIRDLALKKAKSILLKEDEDFTNWNPSELLKSKLGNYGKKKKRSIEIIGGAYKDTIVGYEKNKPDYIAHVDIISDINEIMKDFGLSYFQAGMLPWSEEPKLSDTEDGIAMAIGHSPIMAKKYLYVSWFYDGCTPFSSRFDEKYDQEYLQSSKEKDFKGGFFDVVTNHRNIGILHLLKDRVFREIYGKPKEPDIFHRETVSICHELLSVANGSTRGVMDLRPAVTLIAKKLGISDYESQAGHCAHSYNVSGVWSIIRSAGFDPMYKGSGAIIRFYDENLNELKPEDIKIREVKKDLGYIACGNKDLFKKFTKGLEKVLT